MGRSDAEAPELTVVVPSHDRSARLRRLLDALAAQTLERERFEVVVAHDSVDAETERLLREHPLAGDRTLRHLTFAPGSKGPAEKRNAAWRAARGELIAFTDDDCRPPETWLERLLAACRENPGAVVQGTTRPDPEEAGDLERPWRHSQTIDPPTPWGETCNIAYPRELLERVDGFPEDLWTGEDTDLAWRAIASGAAYVAAPEALTYHCVEVISLRALLRTATRWEDIPGLVRRHPGLRRHYKLGVFWRPHHMWLALAISGFALQRRTPLALLLGLPYVITTMPGRGHDVRGRLRALGELCGLTALHLREVAVLAKGSVKHRSLLL